MEKKKLTLALSSCLTGDSVRYDGNHKYNAYIVESLGQHFSFIQICPEVAIGLGIPREPIHLIEVNGQVRCRGTETQTLDVTDPLQHYARSQTELVNQVSGYIFKKGSPSCGIRNVKLVKEGVTKLAGVGIFAAQIARQFPLLPLADEQELDNVSRRIDFIRRVFVYRRWREMLEEEISADSLLKFHRRHYGVISFYGERLVSALQAVVDQAVELGRGASLASLMEDYIELLMKTLNGNQKDECNIRVQDWLQEKINNLEGQQFPVNELDELKSFILELDGGGSGYVGFLEKWSVWSKNYLSQWRELTNSGVADELLNCFYLNPEPVEFELLRLALVRS